MTEGAASARQIAASCAALTSGRNGKGQAPAMGHLPTFRRCAIHARCLRDACIVPAVGRIAAEKLLREVRKVVAGAACSKLG